MALYPSTVKCVNFYVLGDDDNIRDSYAEIDKKDSFHHSKPVEGGIYDPHLGTTENDWRCLTCLNPKLHCPGHEGHISLKYPVQNPVFKEEIVQWLKIICFNCGNLIINKLSSIENTPRIKKLSTYVSLIRNTSKNICTTCGEKHPNVSRDKNRPVTIWAEYFKDKELDRKTQLFNNRILEIFQKVTNETVESLGKPISSHPSKFIISIMRVPSNTIRPDIKRIGGGRSNNNILTIMIKAIVDVNSKLPLIIPKVIDDSLEIHYTNLDMVYHELIKGSAGSSSKNKIVTNTNKPPGSISSRFPQKTGRIRENLMGTRVWYSARTVISCDPMIPVDGLGVPIQVATNIQIPEVVNSKNRSRLMMYFNNKRNEYPGCTTLIKKRTGAEYCTDSKNSDIVVEDGDTIMRDLIDGDVAIFNRQPTMSSSSMSSHTIKIMKKGNTFRLNISACVFYNADFDGDEMNLLFARSPQSINEIKMLSNIGTNFISKVNGSPLPGCFQDTLASLVELTSSNVKISKYNAMTMCKNVPVKLTEPFYTGRELVSLLLPMINFETKAKFYNEAYSKYLKYPINDVNVKIKQGKIISGILDYNSCGQEKNNSIFHIIHNEYGAKKALQTLFDIQQICMEFTYFKGFTVSMDDFKVSKKSIKDIHDKTSAMITESKLITKKLERGEIIPPIGLDVKQFYEQLQINTLSLGDDFVEPILSNVDTENSGFYKMIAMCKKGKIKNLQAITSAMGSSLIDGKRASTTFGYFRTLPYFPRFDMDPLSNGFIADSFIRGVSPASFMFAAQEARIAVINKSLSTSIPGQRGRESIKNMESLIANNLRQCMKNKLVVQFLYGGDGVDVRTFEKNILPTVLLSNKDFDDRFHCTIKDLPKKYNNKEITKLLDDEFKKQTESRNEFRIDNTVIEYSTKDKTVKNTIMCSFNIKRIINNVLYGLEDVTRNELDVVKAIEQVNTFCDEYPYIYINTHQKKIKGNIPDRFKYASKIPILLIRSHLHVKGLISREIDNKILSLILDKILLTASQSLIDYGTPIGSLSSQSLSSPMTQYIIDSHHRAGVSGGMADSRTDTLTRSDELIFAKSTEDMKNPSLTLYVKEEFENDETKVIEIANHIESMSFIKFVDNLQIFFEEYKNPIHPDYKHEYEMISEFEKHNPSIEIPSDLSNWVIRLQLDKLSMILKNMDLETIIFSLMRKFPGLHIVYTHENSPEILLRCYIRNIMFKKSQDIKQSMVEDLKDRILNTIVRGVVGIDITYVTKKVKSYIDKDGSMKNKSINIIITKGTNFHTVAENPNIDIHKCQSDSIKEVEELFGIEAARCKLRYELEQVGSEMGSVMAAAHYSAYADELSITGKVRGISKTGLELRESKNILLRTSYSHPNQVLKSAAMDGRKSEIYGLSAPLVLGRAPYSGSTYNQIAIDHDFIASNTKTIDEIFDDL